MRREETNQPWDWKSSYTNCNAEAARLSSRLHCLSSQCTFVSKILFSMIGTSTARSEKLAGKSSTGLTAYATFADLFLCPGLNRTTDLQPTSSQAHHWPFSCRLLFPELKYQACRHLNRSLTTNQLRSRLPSPFHDWDSKQNFPPWNWTANSEWRKTIRNLQQSRPQLATREAQLSLFCRVRGIFKGIHVINRAGNYRQTWEKEVEKSTILSYRSTEKRTATVSTRC